MATLTIRNLPDDVYERLKAHAQRHHRSLAKEVGYLLEQAARRPLEADEFLEEARRLREAGGPAEWVTEEFVREAKEAGRP